MKQPHKIQKRILFDLLFAQKLRYTELKPLYMENSQFVFHIKKLIEEGYIQKEQSHYTLTDKGKEYANQMDVDTLNIQQQSKITTVLCGVRKRNNKKEYLVHKRLKNPFYECQGFPTQKTLWGENIEDTAIKGLKEETGLEGKPILFAIRHYKILSPEKKLLEDKLMHAFLFQEPKGNLESNQEGDFFWATEKELKEKITKPLEEFWEFFNALKTFKNQISFKEIETITHSF